MCAQSQASLRSCYLLVTEWSLVGTMQPGILEQVVRTRAYAAMSATAPLLPYRIDRRDPGPHDAVIDIRYCGVCHTDIHQVRDQWGGSKFPIVPGHEIVGTVVRVGDQVERWRVGDTVGVGCIADSCRECESCRAGEEQFCERGFIPTYNGYERDGLTPTYGGYSMQITMDEAYIVSIPAGLPLVGATPLLCAGISVYSPLRRLGAKPGESIGVVGLGGLGHIAVKVSRAMGLRVAVLSHSAGKRYDALRLGADEFLTTCNGQVFDKNAGRFDYIMDTVSMRHDYDPYLNLLRRDGTMTLLGLPEPGAVAAASLIRRRCRLTGSLIGGLRETQEMLTFCAQHGIWSETELI